MISFTSKDSGKQLVIGGVSSLDSSANEVGIIGPFPRYSINREELTTADGTYINSKFNITVTGTATLKSTDSQDMLKKGERQSRVQGESIILAQLNRNQWPLHGNGMLEIAPYGGQVNKIVFRDARILSIDLPEQNETAGVQNQEYTIQFEAYEDASETTNSNNPDGTTQPTYRLSSVEESWELTPSEGYSYKGNKFAGDAVTDDLGNETEAAAEAPYKTFTLTHTLSATGLKEFAGKSTDGSTVLTGLADDGESWRQAAEYIGARLQSVGDPLTAIKFNTLNLEIKGADGSEQKSNQFNASYMDSDDTNLKYSFSSEITNPDFDPTAEVSEDNPETLPNAEYKAYDHVRTVSSNVSAGSYSVTDTWVLAYKNPDGQAAITDLTIDLDISSEAEMATVTLNGTIQGLDTTGPTAHQHNKYANAKGAYNQLAVSFFDVADSAYKDYEVENECADSEDSSTKSKLRETEFSKNVGFNEQTGTITFSVSFNDKDITDEDVIEESFQVDDSGATEVVAIIGVILKANGPVIQDMGTITEKRKSVTYTAKMKKCARKDKPDKDGVIDSYKPTGGYLSNNSESWNEQTGDYTRTKEWVYV